MVSDSTQPEQRNSVRAAVRGLLESNPAYANIAPPDRKRLAQNLVQLTETSLELLREEAANAPRPDPPLATAMSEPFDPAANRQLSDVAQATLEGIAFPRFVTELVNGVYRGLIDANAQQLQAYVEMISGVTAASADSPAATGPDQARVWLMQQFPDAYELGTSQDDWGNEEENGSTVVRLREGRDGPPREEVAALLELTGEEAEGFDTEEPEEGLLSRVRAYLSRKKQKVIASLLTLGMNRLVIDHGKIKAGMNFSIDARSAAEENRARRFEMKHTSTMGGSVGFGPWSVNASMTNSIGIVNTNQSHRSEEMNQNVNMNADVELHFHSDYLPLNQLAAADSVNRIRAVSLNPNAPAQTRAPRQPSAAQVAARSVVNTPIQHAETRDPPQIQQHPTGNRDQGSDASQGASSGRDQPATTDRQAPAGSDANPTASTPDSPTATPTQGENRTPPNPSDTAADQGNTQSDAGASTAPQT